MGPLHKSPPKSKSGSSRALAARILLDVAHGQSLSDALRSGRKASLSDRDNAFVSVLAYGVCRFHEPLEFYLQHLLQRPLKRKDTDLKYLIMSALFQLQKLNMPPHAAVSATVDAVNVLGKRWASGLVNAVLRRYLREKNDLAQQLSENSPAQYACPQWLLHEIQQAWPQQWQKIVLAWQQQPVMSLRVNLSRTTRSDYARQLQKQGMDGSLSELSNSGIILQQPQDVYALPGFEQGLVSVQDAGAQLAANLLSPQAGQQVLDACAAPGGKSGHLLEITNANIHLTAADISARRLQDVTDNLARLGLHADIRAIDLQQPDAFPAQTFERVLLDAPCSATGVIQRHPDIKCLRRESDIASLCEQQHSLLQNAWQWLKTGGQLLYVTCSVLPQENERQIKRFLQEHTDARLLDMPSQKTGHASLGLQLLPGEGLWDGFYYALLEKS
ncbi:MAG: 16S rRNA (cytosine(967)-C(5))-methyltransferase RsmB [gamma proteobacterium symbiont of Bathyaustriella thionipta]|nr:16S rRNA (cytosine(967)-C(5))-methyltransferase RsmB [gamma proteobacterium symbiont of Bathyaustriella thionipta]